MAHKIIFEKFKSIFPHYSEIVDSWFPNGKNSVRIRFIGHRQDIVFTYSNTHDWRLETLDSFIKSM